MEARLLVHSVEDGALGVLLREKSGGKVELETLGHVVLKLNLGAEDVRGRPSLSEDEAVGLVEVLRLNVAGDATRLVVAEAGDLERRRGGRHGLDLEGGTMEGEVLGEEVIGRLAEVLCVARI